MAHANRNIDKKSSPSPEEIKQCRLEYELSVEESADLVYARPIIWEKWESGEKKMPLPTWELYQLKCYQNALFADSRERHLGIDND